MRKKLSLIVLMSMIVGIAGGCSSIQKTVEYDKNALLEEAYVYTLPLMIMDATNTKITNTVTATQHQAPENQFVHARNLATADSKDVVTPNVDTVYSQVFLNLSEDAVVVELPKTDRFCNAEIMDAYSNCISVIDTAKLEEESQKFIFTGPGFKDSIPEGMKEIKSPTNLVWVLVRTICKGDEDIQNVYGIQEKMDSYTLEQYMNNTIDQKPEGIFDEDNNFIPVQHVMKMTMDEYFSRANQLMAENPPAEADSEIVERLSKIGVGASLEFDSGVFGDETGVLWKTTVSGIVEKLQNASAEFVTQNGIWTYFGKPIAEFGKEYYYRAYISLVGFGANPVSVAVYPKTDKDVDDGRLNGENEYVLHFEKDGIPEVSNYGFWSITAYNSSDNLLIDNEINRYCVNDRSGLVYNDDGSLDIYISKERPSDDKASNWLPVSSGEFHLVFRIYYPSQEIVDNKWQMPIIRKKVAD